MIQRIIHSFMAKGEQQGIDAPEYSFPVRYWCAHGCGQHFDGHLHAQVFRPVDEPIQVRFTHDRCIYCGDERTSPHVDPRDKVPTYPENSLEQYVSAIKLSLGLKYTPTYEYLPAQPKDEPWQ